MSIKLNKKRRDAVARDIQVVIQLYKRIIELTERENDYAAKELFERILADEEEHHEELVGAMEEDK